jgi:hypothetical protein
MAADFESELALARVQADRVVEQINSWESTDGG